MILEVPKEALELKLRPNFCDSGLEVVVSLLLFVYESQINDYKVILKWKVILICMWTIVIR